MTRTDIKFITNIYSAARIGYNINEVMFNRKSLGSALFETAVTEGIKYCAFRVF